MKKWFRSDSRIIFNVILALIIGIVLGNFLGSSMLKNEDLYANAVNYNDDVYILQSGVYYDEQTASNALKHLKDLGLSGIIVKEHDNYYIYNGISTKTSAFSSMTKILDDNGIDYLIKSKQLYYMLSDLDPSSSEYQFYYDSINYYLSLIHGKKVVMSDDFVDSVTEVNLDLYNNLHYLNESLTSDLSSLYKLYIYKDLVDLLL